MCIEGRASLAVVLSTLFLATSCGRRQTFTHYDASSLADIARTYGQDSRLGASPSVKQVAEKQTPAPTDLEDNEGEYRSQIAADLVQKNFDALEKAAREARTRKTRFKGGAWKLFFFYAAVSMPIVGDQATDQDWTFHIATLKAWESARPESATARIALAQAYENYADKATGAGYANTVSETGWKLSNERIALAASILTEAAKLKEKCPYWYEAMQHVALAQGWDKSQARKLLEEAVAFEPGYYHVYREYANFLLPKWYGEPGEAEAFAEEVSKKVGGPEGKLLYFEIASLITCQCDSDDSHMENLSWPEIKEGYAALGQLYGYSNLKMNRFAHMAVEAQDKAAAQQVFARLGNDWDHTVWGSSLKFDNARLWAAAP